MKKWVNAYAPLYALGGEKLITLPAGAVVVSMETVENFNGIPRETVLYVTQEREYYGDVYTGYLEPYVETLPTRCVTIFGATPNPNDAEQYAMIYGVKQTDLCGEICAAYLLNIPLEDLLAEWQRESPGVYQRVFNWFSSKKAKGTGPADVQSMLAAFERPSHLLVDALRDPILKTSRYTVSGLAALVGRAIVTVRIDKYTGRLKPSGVLHWVVVTRVVPERAGYGAVELFNPFPNRIESYSWSEFLASAGNPYGVVVDE